MNTEKRIRSSLSSQSWSLASPGTWRASPGERLPLRVEAGATLVREGHAVHAFFVMIQAPHPFRGGRRLAELRPGDFFGDGGFRSATVTAATDVLVQINDQRGFYALVEGVTGPAQRLLATTARRPRQAERSSLRHRLGRMRRLPQR